MIYLRYHVWRFKQYWKKEGRDFKRDVLSLKLFSQIGYYLGFMFFFVWILTRDIDHAILSGCFFVYSIGTHLYRDYNKGYHIGWNRARIKESVADAKG